MIRGCSQFMTTIQPTPTASPTPISASGLSRIAARIGGTQATNGPKNGIIIRRPAVNVVTGT